MTSDDINFHEIIDMGITANNYLSRNQLPVPSRSSFVYSSLFVDML